MAAARKKMPETMYRASRCCRVLGNPTAYMVLKELGPGRMSPSRISQALGIPLPTVSVTLRNLRQVDLVRYETVGTSKEYRIKDNTVPEILVRLERWADNMRIKLD